jgi:hypothetical protein
MTSSRPNSILLKGSMMKKKQRLRMSPGNSLKILSRWKRKYKKPLIMRISRELGCLNYRRSFSKLSKGLSSCRGEQDSTLRLGKILMEPNPGGSMGQEQGRVTILMAVEDPETQVEDRPRNLECKIRTTTDQCQIT